MTNSTFRLIPCVMLCAVALSACGSSRDPVNRTAGGAAVGAAGGAAVGALFGGVGAIPGALVGAAVGGTTGAVTNEQQVDLGEPVWKG
jgi:osmotically inducible lipoprotein OsmB